MRGLRHFERSEAILEMILYPLDCFVVKSAPRNDGFVFSSQMGIDQTIRLCTHNLNLLQALQAFKLRTFMIHLFSWHIGNSCVLFLRAHPSLQQPVCKP